MIRGKGIKKIKDCLLVFYLLFFAWDTFGSFFCGLHLYGGDDEAIVVGVIE